MSNNVFYNRVTVEFEIEDAIVANGQKQATAKVEKKLEKLAKELQKKYIAKVYTQVNEVTKEG
tara:strand:+ start:169 stop:357 length:189 start_codon:yes stop_codon:yes gene_type:complete